MRDNDVVESRSVVGFPPATALREDARGTATLTTQITSMTLTVVAQRTRANPGARVRENPEALRRQQPGPTSLKPLREVADVMAVNVPRFNRKFATTKTNPNRRMCIGTGQSGAFQRSCAPARYPRMRTDRGGDRSTASLARRSGRRHPQELIPPILTPTYDRPKQAAPTRHRGTAPAASASGCTQSMRGMLGVVAAPMGIIVSAIARSPCSRTCELPTRPTPFRPKSELTHTTHRRPRPTSELHRDRHRSGAPSPQPRPISR